MSAPPRTKKKKRSSRKQSVIANLKRKFKLSAGEASDSEDSSRVKPRVKSERKIEIGWLHFSEKEERYTQVRTRNGGGSRKVLFPKDGKKADILSKGKSLFFPNGISPKGKVDDFEFEVMDFKENSLDDDETVGDIYDKTMLTTLRFYIATKKKETPCPLAAACELLSEDCPSLGAEVEVPFETELFDPFAEGSSSEDSSVIQFGPFDLTDDSNDHNQTVENQPEEYQDGSAKFTLVVKRNRVMSDMIEYFSSDKILERDLQIRMMGLDGQLEKGVGDGVIRDCLTEFWSEFKDSCTTGSSFKVPYLRHDFGQRKWEAVGRVIVYGWKTCGYFPAWLAPPFMQVAICDSVLCSVGEVREIFLEYVSEVDKEVLSKALQDFKSVDYDDILDALSTYNCRKVPTEQNLKTILDEIAHKELVQEPMFVAKCFFPILQRLNSEMNRLKTIHHELKATAKKVIGMFNFPENMTPPQSVTANYLKKYVKCLDQHHLELLLRFCTGSDLLIISQITVTFIEGKSDFARNPVAHTCTCLLELPFTYENFPQFKSEFNGILNSGLWVMDME